ncbi:MAG: hypothetical protein ABI158_01080 [Edaphobacter sp.]
MHVISKIRYFTLHVMRANSYWLLFGGTLSLAWCAGAKAQMIVTSSQESTNNLVATMLKHEDYEAAHRGDYTYLSKERSDRTGGHLWTEKVVETSAGKVRMLIAEDGKLLSSDRLTAEKERLAEIVKHPDMFQKQQQARKDDEQHAKEMLDLLPKAFIFENERPDGKYMRIDFKPNPDYEPQSMEERVLHGMTGSMLVDPRVARLRKLEGRLPEDVSIGFGLLAIIHAGSNFSTTRGPVPGNEWKTAVVDTDINGRAIFFKTITRKEDVEHSEFKQVPMNMTVAQAVKMLEK